MPQCQCTKDTHFPGRDIKKLIDEGLLILNRYSGLFGRNDA